MKRLINFIMISVTLLTLCCLVLYSFLPWQAVLVLGLMLLLIVVLIFANYVDKILPHKKQHGIKDEEILKQFRSLLKKVFIPSIVLESKNTSQQYQIIIDASYFTIGREESCNYVLPLGDSISRKHICIQFHNTDESYTVTDLNSTNGTKLNNQLIKPFEPYTIHLNDEISFAGIPFVVKSAYY